MSKTTVEGALRRIEVAPEHSPVAVFLHPQEGYLETMFADSMHTQNLIEQAGDDLVGEYTSRDFRFTEEQLVDTLRGAAMRAPAADSVLYLGIKRRARRESRAAQAQAR